MKQKKTNMQEEKEKEIHLADFMARKKKIEKQIYI